MKRIRIFTVEDVSDLLQMMRDLADFEGYLDSFCVKDADLIKYGLCDQPLFYAWVCEETDNNTLCGMAVTYVIPWTYDLRPNLVLKELFVKPKFRGLGVGELLMKQVMQQAKQMNASKIKWTVLNDNDAAVIFYQHMGAKPDQKWQNWKIDLTIDDD